MESFATTTLTSLYQGSFIFCELLHTLSDLNENIVCGQDDWLSE